MKNKSIVLIFVCFYCCYVSPQNSVNTSEKQKAIAKTIKKVKKEGYAFNQTFDDFEDRIVEHQKYIDTTTTVKTFVLTMNEIFDSYGLSHFWIWTPDEIKELKDNSSFGLGANLAKTELGYFVTKIVDNSPAQKSGIKTGDYIIEVNSKKIKFKDLLKGYNGQVDTVSVIRNDTLLKLNIEYFSFRSFSKDSMYALNANTTVITVNSFISNVYDRRAIESFFDKAKHTENIILDLRSNGGGNSENVQHLLSMIIPRDRVCQYFMHREDHEAFVKKHNRNPKSLIELINYNGREFKPLKLKSSLKVYSGNIFVIVDERSGSGGDVFPSCVQDVQRGKIIGNKTAGQVLSGESYKLNNGMVLFYPTGEYLRLSNQRLEGNGCIPDKLLSREETANSKFVLDLILSEFINN
ncbi:S41 family peptidase [uncultured Psychroserpens sp.]|uniref:S41 family peptidase n=1 Tax=uncultured Psychroserpens sp. TaxID=255436 RepID=UPI00262B5445|nr:S41 family peptidase [uncultured Psychroserpens sp.]